MSPRATTNQSSGSRALANQERVLQMERMHHMGRSLLILVATLLSFACITLLVADQLYRPDSFVIDRLKIKGQFRYLDPLTIEQLVAEKRLGNFFSIELSDIKRRVEDIAWVQEAQVRRAWPDTLLISVTEQRPVMRWGSSKWVNERGNVIDLPKEVTLLDPIILEGSESDAPLMMHQANLWSEKLRLNGLRLLTLKLSESHSYHLQLTDLANNTDFDLLLGRDHTETRLARFLMLFGQQFKESDQQIHRVDARYPNGLAIKASPRPGVGEVANDQLASSSLIVEQNKLDSFSGNGQ